MNKDRRKRIGDVLEILRAIDLESIKDEEQDAFDNMPESLQQGDRGQDAETAISNLEEAINSIESAISALE